MPTPLNILIAATWYKAIKQGVIFCSHCEQYEERADQRHYCDLCEKEVHFGSLHNPGCWVGLALRFVRGTITEEDKDILFPCED